MPVGFRSASGNSPIAGLVSLVDNVHLAKRKALVGLALVLVGAIKLKLSQPGTGKLRVRGRVTTRRRPVTGKVGQYRSNISKLDRASAPGEPPAVDNNVLRNSVSYEQQFSGKTIVGTGNEYAEPLEYGTKRIAPRPFMRPALADSRTVMGEVMISELRKAVRTR